MREHTWRVVKSRVIKMVSAEKTWRPRGHSGALVSPRQQGEGHEGSNQEQWWEGKESPAGGRVSRSTCEVREKSKGSSKLVKTISHSTVATQPRKRISEMWRVRARREGTTKDAGK